MNPETTLESQLRHELEELSKATERYRDAELEERRLSFQQPIDMFDMSWQDRLNQEERAELRGANVAAQEAARQSQRDGAARGNEADREALPAMGKDDRQYLWHAEHRGEPLTTRESQANAAEIYEVSRQAIQERYSDLRLGLEQGIQAIQQASAPGLSQTIERLAETARAQNAMFSLDAYRILAEKDPEAARELSRQMQPEEAVELEHQR